MLKTLRTIVATLLLMSLVPVVNAQSDGFIRDTLYTNKLKNALIKDFKEGTCTPIEDLQSQLTGPRTSFVLRELAGGRELSPAAVYEKAHPAVLVLGKLYKQPQAQHDLLYQATAFVIDPDGLCVTNYHVFAELWNGTVEEKAMGVMDVEGNYYPVREVISAKKADDVVVFRIDTRGKKLAFLPMGEDVSVGSDVHIISHPANNFFYFSSGIVTRKYWYDALNTRRISVSADFALGSSGGPILDSQGRVVGVVAATISIPSSRNQQMVAKEIIPAAAIFDLTETELQP